MRRSSLLLTCAVLLTIPASARALPVDTPFTIVVSNGPDPNDAKAVGALSFKLIDDMGRVCRYAGGWSGAAPNAIVTGCVLEEMKTHGHASCLLNSQDAFDTVILKGPRAGCTGFDVFGQHRDLFLLIGAESADPAGIIGILQWTAAMPIVSAFAAETSP